MGEEKQSGATTPASSGNFSTTELDKALLKDPDVIEEDDPTLAQPDAEEDLAGPEIVPAPLSERLEALIPEEPDAT